MMDKTYKLDWGIFALVEFLGSHSAEIGGRFTSTLNIGSGDGIQLQILRDAGLEVFQLDKYSEKAEFKNDFLDQVFDQQFDIIYCSHVIEHQRNVGLFLDKIYDTLSDDGLLLLTAPKHPADRIVEGHLNCFYITYLIQQLIHAGFDLKAGKVLSCGLVENAVIASKARNFSTDERHESGYQWNDYHKERSPIPLDGPGQILNDLWLFHNCNVLSSPEPGAVKHSFRSDYKKMGITIDASRWGFTVNL